MTAQKRILVVEDDILQAIDLEMAVEAAGMQPVGPAGTVSQAMTLAERAPPDFAVLDFNLGTSTSIAVARKLEALHVPFVYLTGKSREQLLKRGAPDAKVFQKPFPPEQVMAFVSTELSGAHMG